MGEAKSDDQAATGARRGRERRKLRKKRAVVGLKGEDVE